MELLYVRVTQLQLPPRRSFESFTISRISIRQSASERFTFGIRPLCEGCLTRIHVLCVYKSTIVVKSSAALSERCLACHATDKAHQLFLLITPADPDAARNFLFGRSRASPNHVGRRIPDDVFAHARTRRSPRFICTTNNSV